MIRTDSSSVLRSAMKLVRHGLLAVIAGASTAFGIDAQASQAPQAVSLRIGPPVGETLRMRLDQRVEMTGTTRNAFGDTTATVVATLSVVSRAFVERRERDATIVLASTDSVAVASNG